MLAKTDSLEADAQGWLVQFENALAGQGDLAALFHTDSYWRDVVALTWGFRTFHGAADIGREIAARRDAVPSNFTLDRKRTAPRPVTRAGTRCTEAIFSFETKLGRGSGVLRLT